MADTSQVKIEIRDIVFRLGKQLNPTIANVYISLID